MASEAGGAGREVMEGYVGAGGFVCEVGLSESGVHGGGDVDDGDDGGGVGDAWAEGGTRETKVSPGGLDLSGLSLPLA